MKASGGRACPQRGEQGRSLRKGCCLAQASPACAAAAGTWRRHQDEARGGSTSTSEARWIAAFTLSEMTG